MTIIGLELKKSVEENAGFYFDKAKKAKKKIEGASMALEKAKGQLARLERKEAAEQEEAVPEAVVARKKHWYEKFRWFRTSEGLLAVGGRDATTNEIVIKKHAEPDDMVFHTDMAGSPFFVLKTEGKKPSGESIREAADATCSFSKAWKMGLGSQKVFHVSPSQVTKDAQAGEFVPKGAFMIRGKTEYVDNRIDVAIGLDPDGAVMGGPLSAVSAHCAKHVVVEQGDEKPSACAKAIKRIIGGELDDIIRALPSGGCRIRK